MEQNVIGERIREFLIQKYGKLKTGADKLSVSPSALQMYLNGSRLPGRKFLVKLKELGCDIDLLLTNEVDVTADRVSDEPFVSKDKIILSQAEEIHQLKEKLKSTKEKVNKLEKEVKEILEETKKLS